MAARTRIERDSLGEKQVPAEALHGLFTERARETFQLSGLRPHPAYIRALGLIKLAAARANRRLGLLSGRLARAIERAARRVAANELDHAFVLDAFQAGAGTPHHMNANEVIANLANEALGGRRGIYTPIHPNDHVNLGQSSNDVTPTAARLAALALLRPLTAEVRLLEGAGRRLARTYRTTVKPGRTHLQDAVPITYGQVFTGYAEALAAGRTRLAQAAAELRVLGLGGTAVGTGITAHPGFARLVTRELGRLTGERLRPARSTVATTWSMSPLLATSGAVRALATDVAKTCRDLRLLASGPHTGLSELILPAVEPGSSIMPGKVNPSVPEAVEMVCYQVCGNDAACAHAAVAGELELNVMTPLLAFNLWWSLDLLTRAVRLLREKCIAGLRVDRARVARLVEESLVLGTALSPYLGYAVVAELVKEAIRTGRSLREVVHQHDLVPDRVLDRLLDPLAVTRPARRDTALRAALHRRPAYAAYRRQAGLP
ncbi:MAG: aspartate ammonia-lyase [Candidatus Rokubacteria bacterium]|nr:aspartate ammonia-lyase [Candidatus Rokubacteria bacterium]